MSATAAAVVPAHGSGSLSRSRSCRPPDPTRSLVGHGRPNASSVACTRFLSATRWRTRCSRHRARSRSARTSGVGSQIAGTSSRRLSSASTQASIRSVLHANGARPLTFWASAPWTCPPASSSWSCTNRAPFIDSIAAATGSPYPAVCRASPRSPSASGGAVVTCTGSPASFITCTSSLWRDRSNPAYNMAGPPRGAPDGDTPETATGGGPSSWHSVLGGGGQGGRRLGAAHGGGRRDQRGGGAGEGEPGRRGRHAGRDVEGAQHGQRSQGGRPEGLAPLGRVGGGQHRRPAVGDQGPEAPGEAGQVDLAWRQAGQLLDQGVALVPEEAAELGPGCPAAPVDPLPPGGEDEAELGGVGQVEELAAQVGQLEQPALGLGEPAGVAQRPQQAGPPPGQGQAVGAVAAGAAAGEPLPDRAQAGLVEVAPAGEGQPLVGQAAQELADVVGEAAEGAGEQHGWGLASSRWVGCPSGSRFGTAPASLERPGATLGLPHTPAQATRPGGRGAYGGQARGHLQPQGAGGRDRPVARRRGQAGRGGGWRQVEGAVAGRHQGPPGGRAHREAGLHRARRGAPRQAGRVQLRLSPAGPRSGLG